MQIQLECSSSITSLMIIQIFIIYKTIYTFSNVINMKFCIIQAASYQLYLYIPYPYFMTSLEFISTVINDTHFWTKFVDNSTTKQQKSSSVDNFSVLLSLPDFKHYFEFVMTVYMNCAFPRKPLFVYSIIHYSFIIFG